MAAILREAAALFVERGYDAATMTEIAARSGTATGSLYRFFPTKEAVARALLDRCAEAIGTAFADLAARAPALAPGEIADGLVAAMQALRAEHEAALALLDVRPDAAALRSDLRAALRRRIATVLLAAAPALPAARADIVAAVVQLLLKGIGRLPAGEPSRAEVIAEARALARLYLAEALGPAPAMPPRP
ncbi:TetR/AcrR family transcriptional regulator [Rhodovastum atsumiense]|uniref:TetR/AcrR family transcriptional regulator n=1 Tax=Rhodovastum atsumiense TaxID=504468 RepID=UPI00139F2D0C|nr:TetR/AcrR family transcriptional regulator [Rhodovastum atsumiense]